MARMWLGVTLTLLGIFFSVLLHFKLGTYATILGCSVLCYDAWKSKMFPFVMLNAGIIVIDVILLFQGL